MLALLLAGGVCLPAMAGQVARPCEDRACTAADFRAGVNDLHDLKNAFVAALRRFAESVGGSYGDEGPSLPAQLDALQRALDSWDGAIATYEAAAGSAPDATDVHAALASVYLDRLRIEDARRASAVAARLDPQRADIHELSAVAYDFAGDTRGARAALEKASAAAPDDAVTLYRLSVAAASADGPSNSADLQQRVDAARPALPGRSRDAAITPFERAALLRQVAGVEPIFPPQRYVGAFRLIVSGDLAEGLARLRQAMMNDPLLTSAASSPAVLGGARLRQGHVEAAVRGLPTERSSDEEAHRVAGVAYWADEQYDKSIEALGASSDLDRRDERSRIALADVMVAAGRSADAERALKEVVTLMPDSGQAHYRLGLLYQADARIADAVQAFERAAECAPLTGLDHLFETIGALYAAQADLDRAAGAYRRRVEANPNNAEAHRKLGEIRALQGANEAALAEFAVARWLDPRDAEAYAGSSQVYLRLGRFADAANAAKEALALEPAHQKARFALGTALARLGDADGGQRELAAFQQQVDGTAARRRRGLEAEALASQAAGRQAAGDHQGTVQLLQRALDAAPGDSRLGFQLATALSKAGRFEDALVQLAELQLSDDPDVHRLAAEAYAGLGQVDASRREEERHLQLLAQRKQRRLTQRPLLR